MQSTMSVELAPLATNAWGLACCIWVVNAAHSSRRTFTLLLIQLHIRKTMAKKSSQDYGAEAARAFCHLQDGCQAAGGRGEAGGLLFQALLMVPLCPGMPSPWHLGR